MLLRLGRRLPLYRSASEFLQTPLLLFAFLLGYPFRRDTNFVVDSPAVLFGLVLPVSFCREARFLNHTPPLIFDCALGLPFRHDASFLDALFFLRQALGFPFRRDASLVVDSPTVLFGLVLPVSCCREARFLFHAPPLIFDCALGLPFRHVASFLNAPFFLRLALGFPFRRGASLVVDSLTVLFGLVLPVSFCLEARVLFHAPPLIFNCALGLPFRHDASFLDAPFFLRLALGFPFRRDASFVLGTIAPRSHHNCRYAGETDATDAEKDFHSYGHDLPPCRCTASASPFSDTARNASTLDR